MTTASIPELIDLHPAKADMRQLVWEGFQQSPKQLPAWFLYDEEGSRLFEQICQQPEYSLTRTESALLKTEAVAISRAITQTAITTTPKNSGGESSGGESSAGENSGGENSGGENCVIVEFGAGNARKVGPLLKALQPAAYVALDISLESLRSTNQHLRQSFPDTPLLGICCDHSQLNELPPHPLLDGQRRIGFFPGSSLGNFKPRQARTVLRRFRQLLNGGPLLLGLDHPKSKEQLEAAYNDAAGCSAAFASNLLHRLNQELGGSFAIDQFSYQARWEAEHSRVAMELLSDCDQTVDVAGRTWEFAQGEPITTEYSFKYGPIAALDLVTSAGWRGIQRWHDPSEDLSLHLLEPADLK
ncbi:MAG: L-histidine N(alpha)-methyltransferase [Prochlorococcus sp.]